MPLTLPEHITALAAELATVPGVEAVVLGGSRATGTHREDSDWDLGLYYRRSRQLIAPSDVRELGYPGHISELGDWGPIVHGGGWLTIGDTDVDVLFRDLDTLDRWHDEAREGRFEVHTQTGYLVGAPTYLPVGEMAVCQPIFGTLAQPSFPEALRVAAPSQWRGQAEMSMMFACGYAGLGDVVCCVGALTHAVLCTAHAKLVERGEWVLNEKRLVRRADLTHLQESLSQPGSTSEELSTTVTKISKALGVEPTAKQ